MFRESRLLGDTVALPVDTSTRAFRRACSEPHFPFDRIKREAVVLRDAPIELRWPSVTRLAGEFQLSDLKKTKSAPTRCSSEMRRVNPHRDGFGPIPQESPKRRNPPALVCYKGILGNPPLEGTRGDDLEVRGGERCHGSVRGSEEDFPQLNQLEPLPSSSSPSVPPPPPLPRRNPRFKNLSKFLGYFRKPADLKQSSRSYAQVVRAESAPTKMAPPIRSRGGGATGLASGDMGAVLGAPGEGSLSGSVLVVAAAVKAAMA